MELPVRLDFFGDTLESIRSFDPETQRTVMEMRALDLVPVAEFQLTTDTIRKFRLGYVATFGAADPEDMLYEAVTEGRRHPGMEHWLPLFHDKLDTLFDYVPVAPVILEAQAEDVARERLAQIADYYEARKEALAEPIPCRAKKSASRSNRRRGSLPVAQQIFAMHSGQASKGWKSTSPSERAPFMMHSYFVQCGMENMWPVSWLAIFSVRARVVRNSASLWSGSPSQCSDHTPTRSRSVDCPKTKFIFSSG